MQRRQQYAFTLVELLVVIAIIGILVALLLPAVQAARAAARRTTCTNQMRQLALACQNYENASGVFPVSINNWVWEITSGYQAGVSSGSTLFKVQGNGRSWIVSILPQMEETGLYDQFSKWGFDGDFSGSPAAGITGGPTAQGRQIMAGAVQTFVDGLLCPSDAPQNRELQDEQPEWFGMPLAGTNYKGCAGPTPVITDFFGTGFPDTHGTDRNLGMLWRNDYLTEAKSRFRSCQNGDGTSNTFLFGESLVQYDEHVSWAHSNGAWATCAIPPNYFLNATEVWLNWLRGRHERSLGFRSWHPGGIHFAMTDGSTHFISDQIEQRAYLGLSTRDFGEIVDESKY